MEPSTAAAVPATPTRSAENAASASRSPEQPQASSSPSTAGPASHRLHNALRADGIRRTMDAVRRRSYDSMSPEQYRKILIIYTGGTIGMKPSPRGYVPAPGYFEQHLASSSLYHDPEFRKPRGKVTRTSNGSLLSQSFLVSPPWHGGRRSVYKMLEYAPLLDSCNIANSDWLKISKDVSDNYDDYDAFIVLHGTDTMAYTSSALSFVLDNLGKPVIVTGSQIPLSQPLSDGVANLLGALACATQFLIPEVTLFFSGRLMRGNRCIKGDSNSLDAFWSMNYPPLVRMGVESFVDWQKILPAPSASLDCATALCENVAVFRLFPGFTTHSLENLLQPPLQGLVLATFGAGNGPDTRTDMLQALSTATKRGVVIVNVTQCSRGKVEAHYAAGTALLEAGVIPGFDMTAEAALAKLAYLLGLGLAPEKVRKKMTSDLRGELTRGEEYERISFRTSSFVKAVHVALTANNFTLHAAETGKPPSAESTVGEGGGGGAPSGDGKLQPKRMVRRLPSRARKEMQLISDALSPVLLCSGASLGQVEDIEILLNEQGINPNAHDYDRRTPLHIAASDGQLEVAKLLVEFKASVNVLDRWHISPLVEAIRANHNELARFLYDQGATLRLRQHDLASLMFNIIEDFEVSRTSMGHAAAMSKLRLLLECKGDPNIVAYDSRRPLHMAAVNGDVEPIQALLAAKAEVNCLDRWHSTALTEAIRCGNDEAGDILIAAGGRLDGMTRAEQRAFIWQAIDKSRKDDTEAHLLRRVLACGADVNVLDLEGRTALHFAASCGLVNCARILLEAGIDMSVVDIFGRSATDNARELKHSAVLELLESSESLSVGAQ